MRLITGVRLWPSAAFVEQGPRIYFANHSSHLDTLVVWAALPHEWRCRLRPAAAADYWGRTKVHRWVATSVLRAVLIERHSPSKTNDPIGCMAEALEAGDDILIFPEGTRQADGVMGAFKPGLYHLTRRCPNARLIPVHLENLSRILPKGEFLPLPLIAGTRVGATLPGLGKDESRDAFLERARAAVANLGH